MWKITVRGRRNIIAWFTWHTCWRGRGAEHKTHLVFLKRSLMFVSEEMLNLLTLSSSVKCIGQKGLSNTTVIWGGCVGSLRQEPFNPYKYFGWLSKFESVLVSSGLFPGAPFHPPTSCLSIHSSGPGSPLFPRTRPYRKAVDLLVCTIICTEKHSEVGRWLSLIMCQHLQNSSRYEQTVAQIKLNSFLLIQCFSYYTNLQAFCL